MRQPADEPDRFTWSERRVEPTGIVHSVSHGRLADVRGGYFSDANRLPDFSATILYAQTARHITLWPALMIFPKGEVL